VRGRIFVTNYNAKVHFSGNNRTVCNALLANVSKDGCMSNGSKFKSEHISTVVI
jgi:hypothetical protein